MSVEETKRRLLAKARGEDITGHYMRILDYMGNVMDEVTIESSEDWEIIVFNNKEEKEEYERNSGKEIWL